MRRGTRGTGIGWRPELAADLLAHADSIDFVEVTAEGCDSASSRREAHAIAEVWPVVVHGVKTSVGSAEGVDDARGRKLGEVARLTRARFVSEHVAFVRAGGIEVGHLTSIPFRRDAVGIVARNVSRLRRHLPDDVPLLLENIAWSFRWPEDEMDEGDFHAEIAETTGCELLLDVGNLYANAINAGRDPIELLRRYPLGRVGMLHVAGGVREGGFFFDTHAHPLSDAVIDLVAQTLSLVGDVPVVLERDASFPPFTETESELRRLAALSKGAPRPARPSVSTVADTAPSERDCGRLAERQRDVAWCLTAPGPSQARAWDVPREILARKRIDDALPLLPRVAAHGEKAVALAVATLQGAPRSRSKVAVSDAFRIARAAEDEVALRESARADASLLRARFSFDGEDARPRTMPFVERSRFRGGTRWVVKGLGEGAQVRVIERKET